MRFLIDNAISPVLARELCTAGHEAVHLREYGMHRAEDLEVLKRAREESRILISQDTDFGDLLAESGSTGPSVILFRRCSGEPLVQFDLLSLRLPGLAEHLEGGCIAIIEPKKIRIRKLPIGT